MSESKKKRGFWSEMIYNNPVFGLYLGICSTLAITTTLNNALGMGVAVIFVMLASTAVTYPINILLVRNDLEYLQTIVFILVILSALFVLR